MKKPQDNQCPACGRRGRLILLGFMPRPLCHGCFCRNIVRRVRRELRAQGGIFPGQRISIADDGSLAARVLVYILKDLQRDLPFALRIVRGKPNRPGKGEVLVLPSHLEEYVTSFINGIIVGKPFKRRLSGSKFLAPLISVHPDEIRLFALIKRIKGKSVKQKQSKILAALHKIEKHHPDVQFSVLRFSRWLLK